MMVSIEDAREMALWGFAFGVAYGFILGGAFFLWLVQRGGNES